MTSSSYRYHYERAIQSTTDTKYSELNCQNQSRLSLNAIAVALEHHPNVITLHAFFEAVFIFYPQSFNPCARGENDFNKYKNSQFSIEIHCAENQTRIKWNTHTQVETLWWQPIEPTIALSDIAINNCNEWAFDCLSVAANENTERFVQCYAYSCICMCVIAR